MTKLRFARTVAAAMVVVFAVSACGKKTDVPPREANPFAGLPFVLVPDKEGKLVLRDANGQPAAPNEGPLPEQIKAIRALTQVTVLKIEGSCYYWIVIGGVWYKMPC